MDPYEDTPGEGRDIAWIVARLGELRVRSLETRQRRSRPPRLPSRKALVEAMEQLAAARRIARTFGGRLPAVRELLDSDILAAFRGDPAARSIDEVLVCYPGIRAIIHHRLAHELHRLGAPLCARIIAEIAHSTTGIDIHPGAKIAGSFFIDHGTGVVIGETAVIGERVRLYHGVTLGAKRFPVDDGGAVVKGAARHPIVEDDVVVYAGATILGRITIGRGSTIGGNVWLTHGVPPGSNVAQTQASSRPAETPSTPHAPTSPGASP